MYSPIIGYMKHNLKKRKIIDVYIENVVLSKKSLSDSYQLLYSALSRSNDIYNYYYQNAVILLHGKKGFHSINKKIDHNFVDDATRKDKSVYKKEISSNENIKKYGMYINRKPEVELVSNLNELGNKLYKNNELCNFKFRYYTNMYDFSGGVKIKTDDGKTCIIKDEFEFYLPKELEFDDDRNKFRDIFTKTMNTLYLIYINKKYPDYLNQSDYIKAAILNEMIEDGQKIYMASLNVMINRKNIEILSNKDFLNKFTEVGLNIQSSIIRHLMEEIDCVPLYYQAINKIVEDFIEKDNQNNYKYIYQNGKLGKNNNIREDLNEKTVSNELKKALEWKKMLDVERSSDITLKYSILNYQRLPEKQWGIDHFENAIKEVFEENEKIINNL